MNIDDLTDEQIDNIAAALDALPAQLEAYDDGREEGRREMLWLVAIALTFSIEGCLNEVIASGPRNATDWSDQAMVWTETRSFVIRALASLGDERAAAMLLKEQA